MGKNVDFVVWIGGNEIIMFVLSWMFLLMEIVGWSGYLVCIKCYYFIVKLDGNLIGGCVKVCFKCGSEVNFFEFRWVLIFFCIVLMYELIGLLFGRRSFDC